MIQEANKFVHLAKIDKHNCTENINLPWLLQFCIFFLLKDTIFSETTGASFRIQQPQNKFAQYDGVKPSSYWKHILTS